MAKMASCKTLPHKELARYYRDWIPSGRIACSTHPTSLSRGRTKIIYGFCLGSWLGFQPRPTLALSIIAMRLVRLGWFLRNAMRQGLSLCLLETDTFLASTNGGSRTIMVERNAEDRNLDVLRAMAVLLVLFTHIAVFSGAPKATLGALNRLGNAGVIIFFVHTSLVLMRSLERSAARGLSGWMRVRDFYTRRAFRIYPLAVITVLAVVVLHLPRMPRDDAFHPPTAVELVSNLVLLQNLFGTRALLGPLWSLPHEIEMYVVLPFLFVLVRAARWRVLTAISIGAVAVAIGWTLGQQYVPGLWRLSVSRFVPCFVAGVVAFRACQLTKPRLAAWVWPLIVLGLVLGTSLAWPQGGGTYLRTWVLAFLVGGFIPNVRELATSGFTRTAHAIAKYSYGIYLSHIPALTIAIFFMRGYPIWLRIIVAAVGIVGLPLLLYHTVEQPLINLGARVAARLSRRGAVTATLASTAPVP